MATADEVRTLLLCLRLIGSATTDRVVEAIVRTDPSDAGVAAMLGRLELAGLVELRTERWRLTAEGRDEGERLLRIELDARGARDLVTAAYERFASLNGPLLRVCTDWQLEDADPSSLVRNDHLDPSYDAGVLHRLMSIQQAAVPLCGDLADALPRFGTYGPRLAAAHQRVQSGDISALDDPFSDSYHAVWFELHENLIATLGLDRSTEPLPDTSRDVPEP